MSNRGNDSLPVSKKAISGQNLLGARHVKYRTAFKNEDVEPFIIFLSGQDHLLRTVDYESNIHDAHDIMKKGSSILHLPPFFPNRIRLHSKLKMYAHT